MHGSRRGHRAKSTRRVLFGGGALAIAGAATVAVALASAGQCSGGFRVVADGALTKVTKAEGLPAFGESGNEGTAAV